MTNDIPDWIRLHKALAVEAEHGFTDLVGKQYRFSEFLSLTFGKFPQALPPKERSRWHQMAMQFAEYPTWGVQVRQHLVAEVRRYLYQLQQELEEGEQEKTYPNKTLNPTTPIVAEVSRGLAPKIDQKLSELPEIGLRKAENLARLDLYTVRELLFYYPRDHIDYARQVNIQELQGGETVTIIATVKRCNCFTSPKNKKLSILELILKDNTGQIKVGRFYAGARFSSRAWQETLKRRYAVGSVLAACGLVKAGKYGVTLDNPELEVLANPGDAIDSLTIGRVVPIYALTEGVVANTVRQAVITALPATVNLKDPLPSGLRQKYGLMELKDAIANIHFPEDSDTLKIARRRLVFDEFFYLQLGLLQRQKKAKEIQTSAILAPKGQLLENFHKILPFQLTGAQQRVINDILNDLQKSTPMNRLVQGDVGSGKTVVAVVAIVAAIQSGYQAALMAPTEVLAEQHYRKLVSWFNLLHLPVELLTGSTKIAKRREIHSQLETGELPLLVGTHALIQDKVNFQRLGLVVIDEQHRFGVEQRAKLQQKGEQPHVLTMTATPIPRTLALTVHGDLDVSQIDELPPGRQQIKTTMLSGQQRPQAYDLMRREVAQGRQIYVVLPLVEESEKLDLRSAVDEHQKLQESIFPDFQVGLLHGRMTSAEKDEAITKFRDNETQILVSTTVVEVGVDVPNATVMLIEHAERFGLSQLHQLRGRVGRGAAQSYCLLMSSSRSPDAQQRLKVLEQSQDGFFISEMDMRFRGPGEVMGTRQSGVADFTLASLVEDEEVLLLARQAAEKVIDMDVDLERWPLMKDELKYRYARLMGGAILT
ncbi:ATP-dependent DNA helicase RecG [Anabaena cylindrica FACHB-243]|uniref:ATP-dependent DNA helicase RecG n=1 Tax=Anabaena cylindrica (strain ATCC 27899 / PCC 7122) TaxID=272123 RepID=K9ZLL8_ANACC|nr:MULTISPECIES: ATP-dependent DNA helicase RecG [Anabaena]AFZ59200.1 ATP-dependent DNA helicase RecG [Anabaena cylindrica PCC 7122]MBD2416550.1 ATP-dependent DNA helicase RecG [Anabaena cylindrica FACHB-243]MBY5280951.1 ATP-dependent DNA helicase RecG [Anabaena sp. CCAP 1446/1C]MBY5311624.1 ATP-dependent DNA helicase RecG [Anabaena sp. CCAP 1446/1C]MCM2407490.1 ATP-dependent DNA helicase RecG [Anabaena sp. CCAP 1446/1C]